jgi:hypothetical protein
VVPYNKQSMIKMLFKTCVLSIAFVERETGGWVQFDWMLDGGTFKAQPIEFKLVCSTRKQIQINLSYLTYSVKKEISIKKEINTKVLVVSF